MKRKFSLAPMEGYTDPAYRLLCSRHGADFTITEMVSDKRIIAGLLDPTTTILDGSAPCAIQLFGQTEKEMLLAAKKFEDSNFCEININAGCSVKKIIKNKSGAYLIKDLKRLGKIIKLLKKNIEKPISVKTRLGFEKNECIKIAKLIQTAGADSIIIHARTAKQGYSGNADWNSIKSIKEKLDIPVYGNGDIKNWKDAYKMLNETKCDGVYIGRAALGNPFIFEECKKKKDIEHNEKLAKKGFLEYYKLREKYKIGYNCLKPIALSFAKEFSGARELRIKITQTKTEEEILELFKNL
ncbi:MAG: tRNA-dihydrouridine synthase family protein [Candidatus Micrarchaeia archaeon]